jgi:predicted aspartyl protease
MPAASMLITPRFPMTDIMLRERMARALGGSEALRRVHAVEFSGAMKYGTMSGTRHSVVDILGSRFLHHYDYGVFEATEGFDGSRCWELDQNGRINVTTDEERARETIFELKIGAADYIVNPDGYRLERIDDGPDGELRLLVSLAGDDVESFAHATIGIDPATYLIRYFDRVTLGSRLVTHLSGYRSFDGVMLPTRSETVDAEGNSDRLEVELVTLNPEIDPAIFTPDVDESHDYQFLTGELRTVVPLIHELDHLYAEVVIAGRSYRFMVDTGAESTVIPLELVEQLGLERLGSMVGSGVSGAQEVYFVQLPELWVGDILMTNHRIIALDFTELRKRVPEMGGILGMDFLGRFVVGFDYVKGEMEVVDRSIFTYGGSGRRVPLDLNTFEMSFDGYHGKFRIDTGGTSLSIHSPFVREQNLLGNRDRLPRTSTISGVGTTELTIYAALCHEVTIAGYTLHDMPIRLTEIETGAFSQQRMIGNVGGDIWQKFITWFDFTGGQMYIEPNVGFDRPPAYSRLGLVLKAERGGYFVDSFLTNSPAAEIGVERDDELIEFDGVPANSIPFGPLRARFREPAGTTISMTFRRRDGSLFHTVVTLRDFLHYYDE